MLVCGYFDLSIGSTMMLSGVLCGKLAERGTPIPVIVSLVLLAGFGVGCLNGFLVSVLKINALIATIGTQYMGYGLAMTIWDSIRGYKFEPDFVKMGDGKIFGVFYMMWIMLALLVLFSYFLKYTSAGRRLYFVGGNKEAAGLIGFNDKRILFLAYAVTGLLTALAGILYVARIQSPSQYMGEGIHMTCIIACVVGGGSLSAARARRPALCWA